MGQLNYFQLKAVSLLSSLGSKHCRETTENKPSIYVILSQIDFPFVLFTPYSAISLECQTNRSKQQECLVLVNEDMVRSSQKRWESVEDNRKYRYSAIARRNHEGMGYKRSAWKNQMSRSYPLLQTKEFTLPRVSDRVNVERSPSWNI